MENEFSSTQKLQNGGFSAATDRTSSEFKGVISDAEGLLSAVANLSGEAVTAARAKLQERLTQIRGLLADGEEMARARAKQAVETTDRYVHDSPWQAVGIGVAFGIVIGYLSHRR